MYGKKPGAYKLRGVIKGSISIKSSKTLLYLSESELKIYFSDRSKPSEARRPKEAVNSAGGD